MNANQKSVAEWKGRPDNQLTFVLKFLGDNWRHILIRYSWLGRWHTNGIGLREHAVVHQRHRSALEHGERKSTQAHRFAPTHTQHIHGQNHAMHALSQRSCYE